MELRGRLKAKERRSMLADLPSQRSRTLGSSDAYRRRAHGNSQSDACTYCRRSPVSCDLQRPCTRCIKRDIAHFCHDEPLDDDSNNDSKQSKTTHAAQTVQKNTSSLLDSNLRSCRYTISRDHTEGVEDQKYKILADFGRKHVRAWASLSLANINSPIADPDHQHQQRPQQFQAQGSWAAAMEQQMLRSKYSFI